MKDFTLSILLLTQVAEQYDVTEPTTSSTLRRRRHATLTSKPNEHESSSDCEDLSEGDGDGEGDEGRKSRENNGRILTIFSDVLGVLMCLDGYPDAVKHAWLPVFERCVTHFVL